MLATIDSPYQLFPSLTDEEYAALKADIAERGVMVPIEIDENGCILDGHHRVKIWTELRAEGVKVGDYPRVVRVGMTETEKRNHVRALNLLRRHLDRENRDRVIADMLKDGMSTRQVAEAVGVSNFTVHQAGVRYQTPDDVPAKVNGRDGKQYPAKQTPRAKPAIFANTPRDEERAKQAAQHIEDAPTDKVLTTKRAGRIAREQENARRREEAAESPVCIIPNADLRTGDFRTVLSDVPDNSVRLIFTDPPYPKEFLPLWPALGEFSARVLTPGGLLVAYSGQSYLPFIFAALTTHLEYVWTAAQLAKREKTLIYVPKVYSAWKPLLIFAKPPYEPTTWIDDVIGGTGAEKDGHDWQQAEGEAAYYIERLSAAGELVIDPFVGSGTTAAAAIKLGRKFTGCDIDAAYISKTAERLTHEQK